MLRDTRADQSYFDGIVEYLAERCGSNDERLARSAEAWADQRRIGQAAGDAMRQRWDRFSALYSQGAGVETLRDEFARVLSDAERALRLEKKFLPDEQRAIRFEFGRNKDFYREWLQLVSLALAFRVDDATFDRVVAATEFGWGDRLIDRLIAKRRPAHPIGESLAFRKIVGPLDDAFEAADAEKSIRRYLSKWYQSWKGIWGWGGHEFIEKRVYHGYWAFEVLGVVASTGVDDAPFRENEYYPRDLLIEGVSR